MRPARTLATSAGSRPEVRLQYGVIPYRRGKDQIEILLITSRHAQRWIIPKGWPIGQKPPRDVARIEALEEAGLEGTLSRDPLGFFHYHKRLKDGGVVVCRVAVFTLAVERQLKTWPESAERKRRWFDADGAIESVREQELKALIAALLRGLENAKPKRQ